MSAVRSQGFWDSRWAIRLAAAVIAAAAWASYRPSLNAPFVFDDRPAIVENPAIRHLWPIGGVLFTPPAAGNGTTGRPLVSLSLALNYAAGGLNVRGYHAANLAVHILAALALLGIVRRTVAPGSGAPLALAAALLWAVHPLLTESVTCVIQRNESMVGMFYFLTIYCFVRYAKVERVDPNALSGGGVAQRVGVNALHPWAVLAVLCCLLGMATKEVMVTAPVMVLLYDRTFVAGSFAAAWRTRRGFYLGLASTWLLLAFLVARGGGSRGHAAGFGIGITPFRYAVTQCWAIVRYLRLALWPQPLILDYGRYLAGMREVVPQALFLGGLLAGTAWALVRRPVAGFFGAWFFVILAPSSSVVPLVTQTVAEHRMYLPLAAVVVPAAWALQRGLKRWGLPVCLLLAACLGTATARRNREYRSERSIWTDTVAKWPKSPRAFVGLGLVQAEAGQNRQAIASYEAALRLGPNYPDALSNLGCALRQEGRYAEAVLQFRHALAYRPDYPEVYNNLGETLLAAGDAAGAMGQFRTALKFNPDFPVAEYNLGNALRNLGRPAEAIPHFEQALRLNPDYAEAQNNLGVVLGNAGRVPEALAHLEAALRLRPDYPEAHENLGRVLVFLGRTAEGEAHLREAARLKGGRP